MVKALQKEVTILFTPQIQALTGKLESFCTKETLCQERSTLTLFSDTLHMYLHLRAYFLNLKYVKLELLDVLRHILVIIVINPVQETVTDHATLKQEIVHLAV